jgi:hypothetical protein
MLHRIATSELYRDSPTAVRLHWAFRDFIDAHVLLDLHDDEKAKAKRKAEKEVPHGG